METGILLIKTPPPAADEIGERLARLPGVNRVLVVDGEYQLVATITGKTSTDLSALIERHIEKAEGVEIKAFLTTLRQYTEGEVKNETIGFGP